MEILQVALSNKITQNMGPTQIHKKSFLFKKKKNKKRWAKERPKKKTSSSTTPNDNEVGDDKPANGNRAKAMTTFDNGTAG